MQRRGFLRIFGAAITTPFLPGVGGAASGSSAGAFQIALAHAQKFPVISVGGLSKRGNLSPVQAEAMIKELASKGMVKMVGPGRTGTVRAASKIMINDPWGIARTRQPAPNAKAPQSKTQRRWGHDPKSQAQVAPWLAHLHDLCRGRGMVMSPRCFAG